jgi:hypothetical protein
MKAQNYNNHKRYYAPHHFVFYGLILLLSAGAFIMSFRQPGHHYLWVFMGLVVLLVGALSFMMRQHYALTLQDRIILLEMRYRYFTLTGERLELFEERLNKSQLLSLRFASDEELPGLVKRAIAEQLTGDQIKKAVKSWRADCQRV